jgi:Caudovirus prohead serine protease
VRPGAHCATTAVGLSFGFLVKSSRKRGGVRELTEVDLFEISDYSAPGNRSTAITSLKSRRNGDYRAMRERSRAFMAELLAGAATAARVETKTATAADLRIHDITFSPCRGTLNSPRRGGEPARLVLPRARRDFPPDKGAKVSRLGPGVRSSEESGEN